MFHRVRSEVLQTALEPSGAASSRAASAAAVAAATSASTELEEENLRLQMELKAAEVRRELAEKLPRLAKPSSIRQAGEKNDARARKRRRKRLQRKHESSPPMNPGTCQSLKRGWPAQQPRREAERDARCHAVAFDRWAGSRACRSVPAAAAPRLGARHAGLLGASLAQRLSGSPSPGPPLPPQPACRVRNEAIDFMRAVGRA